MRFYSKNLVSVFLLLTLITNFNLSAQVNDSCSRWDLPQLDVALSINGISHAELDTVNRTFFSKGITISTTLQDTRIIGFSIVYDCENCDIVGLTVCGNNLSEEKFQQFSRFLPSNYKFLDIYNINIERKGKKYVIEWRKSKYPSRNIRINIIHSSAKT